MKPPSFSRSDRGSRSDRLESWRLKSEPNIVRKKTVGLCPEDGKVVGHVAACGVRLNDAETRFRSPHSVVNDVALLYEPEMLRFDLVCSYGLAFIDAFRVPVGPRVSDLTELSR